MRVTKTSADKTVFVFGSNLAGRHGAGAALQALRHRGAIYGLGVGHHGDSYALPTKDAVLAPLPFAEVAHNIGVFLSYARAHPELNFQVTQIGCGLAGFRAEDIAPMFRDAPGNCLFDSIWRPWLAPLTQYWGTFSK